MASKQNNITKEEALELLRVRRIPTNTLKNYIYRATVRGEEYTEFTEGHMDMSYFCRAYNITKYGTTSNRIKNVYKKYRNNPYIEEAFDAIFRSYPNGIQGETPLFEELLESNLQRLSAPKPQSIPQTRPTMAEEAAMYRNRQYNTTNNNYTPSYSSSGGGSNGGSSVAGGVVLLILAALVFFLGKDIFNFIVELLSAGVDWVKNLVLGGISFVISFALAIIPDLLSFAIMIAIVVWVFKKIFGR